jgi:hypothetical protein
MCASVCAHKKKELRDIQGIFKKVKCVCARARARAQVSVCGKKKKEQT